MLSIWISLKFCRLVKSYIKVDCGHVCKFLIKMSIDKSFITPLQNKCFLGYTGISVNCGHLSKFLVLKSQCANPLLYPHKRMFSGGYWNQPACQCVCLCTKN